MADPISCALVLLAAGGSRRMGRPKQLLPVGGKPLLRQVAEAALRSPVTRVIVVLGANAAEIRPCLDGLPVEVVLNEAWAEGMGSSVRVGLAALAVLDPGASGVVLALADQPGFSQEHVERLLETQRRTDRSIVASLFAGSQMPPVFFAANHFPALRALHGDTGARALFQKHADEVATVEVAGLVDLDTPEEYAEYLKRKENPQSRPD